MCVLSCCHRDCCLDCAGISALIYWCILRAPHETSLVCPSGIRTDRACQPVFTLHWEEEERVSRPPLRVASVPRTACGCGGSPRTRLSRCHWDMNKVRMVSAAGVQVPRRFPSVLLIFPPGSHGQAVIASTLMGISQTCASTTQAGRGCW